MCQGDTFLKGARETLLRRLTHSRWLVSAPYTLRPSWKDMEGCEDKEENEVSPVRNLRYCKRLKMSFLSSLKPR